MKYIPRIMFLMSLMVWIGCGDADRLVGPTGESDFEVLTKAVSVNRPGMLLASNGVGGVGTLLELDPATGAGTTIGTFPDPMVSLEFSSQDGRLYGLMTVGTGTSARSQLVVIDPDNASLTPIGFVKDAADPSINYFVAAMGFDDDGALYMIHNTGTSTPDLLIEVNPATAMGTVVGPLSHEIGNSGGTVENGVFYLLGRLRPGGILGEVALFEVDLGSGASTQIGSTGLEFNALGLTTGGDGRLLGTIFDSLYEIDRTTGAASLIGPTGLTLVAGLGFVDTIDQHCPHNGPLSGGAWKNHGEYVSCVSSILNQLKKDGVITGQEKGQLQKQAAQSDIGK